MRDILFRGKDVDYGNWVEGCLLSVTLETYSKVEKKKYTHCIVQPDGEFYRGVIGRFDFVLPETVGQYTGLTDKNGKKIFEGDIVLFEDESPSNYEYHDITEMRCGTIEYGDNCFYITNRIAVEMEDLIYYGKLDVEVIGNIHDNPELLSGGGNG